MKTMLLLSLCITIPAMAAEPEMKRPCHEIKKACLKAGWMPGGHPGSKGHPLTCVKKVMDGEKVAGVEITELTLNHCKAKQALHEKRKNRKKKQS